MNSTRVLLHSFLCMLLFGLFSADLFSQQNYYQRWYFGFNVGIDFSRTPPARQFGALLTSEGCATICDPATGALLFYTDGVTVWNRNHAVMRNGTGLFGHRSSTQSALIVPKPGDSLTYYIFTAYAGQREPLPPGGGRQLSYSVVDLRRESGLGEVTQKNVLLLQPATEKLVGVRHCNGTDYWVVGHELGSNRFFSWLVTAAGVSNDPVVTAVGVVHNSDPTTTASIGYLKASPDGRLLFSIVQQEGKGELYKFDSERGTVGPQVTTIPAHYGATFSPNSELLYVGYPTPNPQIHRYVLVLNGNPLDGASIPATRRTVAEFPTSFPPRSFRALQIGPDRNIYVCVDKHIGVIENADIGGTFRDSVFTYEPPGLIGDSVSTGGLPNCIDGFLSSTPVPACIVPDSVTAKFRQSDTVICEGESIDFTDESVPDPSAWQWTFQGGTPAASGEPNPKGIRYDAAGTYQARLIVRKGNAADTAFRTITVHPMPVADAGPDRVLCPGDTVHLRGSGAGSYDWSPNRGLSCTDCAVPVASPSEMTVYYLTVTNEQGCRDIDSVTVQVLPQIRLTASPDTAICAGQSVALNVSGADRYQWSPSDGLSCTDCANPVAAPEKTTTYSIRGSAGSGACFDYDTITVTVLEPPTADAGSDTGTCAGGSVRLLASGGISYRWDASPDLSCLDCADPLATPSAGSLYRVTVTNAAGCESVDSVRVDVYPPPTADAGEDRMLCPGESVTLTAKGGVSYRWDPSPDLSCLDCANPVATPSHNALYRVTVTDARGCTAVDSVAVGINPAPVADAGEDRVVCLGQSVTLTAGGGVLYRWDPSPDLSCTDCPDPVALPTATATYVVTVTDAEGCSARDSVTIDVRSFAISLVGEQAICPGDSVRLRIEGGESWRWEPSDGLSCDDCPDPVAFPQTTRTYRVTATSADGCVLIDSVRVRVRENAEEIRVRISRDLKGAPGAPLVIPVELADEVVNSDIRDLLLELEYDPKVMVMENTAESIRTLLPGTLLEGWNVEIVEARGGRIILRLTAPAGEVLSGRGELMRLLGRMYLSDVGGTELPLRLGGTTNCFAFAPEPGYAALDSVCGLSLRLIETSAQKYSAPTALPNPARDRVRFRFALGLDGATEMAVFDALGNRVALVVGEYLDAGEYEVEWDVRSLPAGMYTYRLQSGDWNGTGRLLITE